MNAKEGARAVNQLHAQCEAYFGGDATEDEYPQSFGPAQEIVYVGHLLRVAKSQMPAGWDGWVADHLTFGAEFVDAYLLLGAAEEKSSAASQAADQAARRASEARKGLIDLYRPQEEPR